MNFMSSMTLNGFQKQKRNGVIHLNDDFVHSFNVFFFCPGLCVKVASYVSTEVTALFWTGMSSSEYCHELSHKLDQRSNNLSIVICIHLFVIDLLNIKRSLLSMVICLIKEK